jgi:hypothetical protein
MGSDHVTPVGKAGKGFGIRRREHHLEIGTPFDLTGEIIAKSIVRMRRQDLTADATGLG